MTPLHLRHFGTGAAPALLLHCGLGSGAMWKGVAGHLADRFTMTAPDLPGHGRSPAFGPGDVHDQATEAVRPLAGPGTHLVGHSFGATVALRLAVEAPDHFASLSLVEPVFFAAAAGHPSHAPHHAEEMAIFAMLEAGDPHGAAERFNRLWGGGVPWERFPPAVQQGMAQAMPFVAGTVPAFWQDRAGLLEPGRLERISCPVVLVRGAATVPIIAAVHAGLLGRLAQASEVVVGGAGHMLVTTHPEAVAQAAQAAVPA